MLLAMYARHGEQMLDRAGIGMSREDVIEHRPDPRDPAARGTRRNGDAERDVSIELN